MALSNPPNKLACKNPQLLIEPCFDHGIHVCGEPFTEPQFCRLQINGGIFRNKSDLPAKLVMERGVDFIRRLMRTDAAQVQPEHTQRPVLEIDRNRNTLSPRDHLHVIWQPKFFMDALIRNKLKFIP